MTFDKYTPWADGVVNQEDENGPKVETDETFTETKISNGATAERLPYPTYNRVHNRADNQIVSILENGISMCEDDIDVEIAEGRMSSARATSHGLSAANRYNVGSATTRFGRIWPTRIGGVKKCLAIDCSLETGAAESPLVYVIDRDDGTVVTHDLSIGFSVTPKLLGICADGTYCYVAANTVATNYWVQCFDMDDWTVRVGWPEYGVSTTTNGGWSYPVDLIIADATYLAIHGREDNPVAGVGPISLINRATGVLSASGSGDYVSGASEIFGLRSNGTYLFFSADEFLCSADIEDLTGGCGGTGWPYVTSGNITDIACRGDLVAVCHGNSAIVEVARVQNALYATVTITGGTPYVHSVEFDDTSLWMRISRIVGATRRQELLQIGLQSILPENGSSVAAIDIATGSVASRVFDIDLVHPTAPGANRMRWDGRDLWIPGEATATATAFNPYIFRYPHTRNNRGILY